MIQNMVVNYQLWRMSHSNSGCAVFLIASSFAAGLVACAVASSI